MLPLCRDCNCKGVRSVDGRGELARLRAVGRAHVCDHFGERHVQIVLLRPDVFLQAGEESYLLRVGGTLTCNEVKNVSWTLRKL